MPRAGGEYCVLRLIRQVYRKRSVPGQVEPVRQTLTADALVRRRGYAKPAPPCLPPLSTAVPTGFASFCSGFGGRLVHARGMPGPRRLRSPAPGRLSRRRCRSPKRVLPAVPEIRARAWSASQNGSTVIRIHDTP